eukprot:TRINITY_DN103642_c2_g1_i1.p1 TRINITY_DN103642_c2_g1~~TRINITY_DN103642_c2_g1_i1.p1  ORF type:complete len:218 (+),score=34.04 TRINITY_DN103642_c2_g1_i1:409-1062(+)
MDQDALSDRFYYKGLQSRSDLYLGFEEMDVDEEHRAEFPCPFCTEDFDIVGLCCHIDEEHPTESKNGVCPVCATRVGMDMVGHITMQHGHFFKIQRKRRLRRASGGPYSTLSLLKKELREGHLQSLLGGSCVVSSSNTTPDPLLSSFMYNMPLADASKNVHPHSSDGGNSVSQSSNKKVMESIEPPSCLSEEDHKEKAQRSEFVQQLVLSTFLDDIL